MEKMVENALLALNEGRYEESLQLYLEILPTLKTKTAAEFEFLLNTYNHIGFCYHKLEQFPLALEYYLLIQQYEPENPTNLANLGICYQMLQEFHTALSYHKRIYQKQPEDAWNLRQIGNCYHELSDYETAVEYLLQSYERNEEDVLTAATLGYTYQKLGEFRKGLHFHKRALELNDYDDWNLRCIAFCYQNLQDYGMAVQYYLQADDIKADVGGRIQMAKCYQFLQNYERAIYWYEEIIAQQPDNADILQELAQCYLDNGNYNAAIEVGELVLDTQPFQIAVLDIVGFAYQQRAMYSKLGLHTDYYKAIEFYERAIEAGDTRSYPLEGLGYCYQELDNYTMALRYYRKAVKLNPNLALLHDNMGYCHNQLEQHQEALACLLKSYEIDETSSWNICALGKTYFRLGELEKAQKFLTRLEKEFFEGLSEYDMLMLGHLYLCLDKYDKALRYYRESYARFEDKDEFLDDFEDEYKYIQKYGVPLNEYRQLKMELSFC
jgi:tetratricopeptide (TPR) repeat protein